MITKADIILAVVLLILGIGSPFLLHSDAGDESRVIITVDGQELADYSLYEDRTVALTENGVMDAEGVPESSILNLIVIRNAEVHVEKASCGGQDCVRMGTISREGQVIACLPHRLLISIGGGSGSGPDVIIK